MNLKTFAAALLIGVSSSAAMAADLPSRKVAPVPAYAPPVFTWSGFYLGLQAGYAWDKVSLGTSYNFLLPAAYPFASVASVNRSGFVGGAHVGYLFQTGPVVLGLEGDVEGTTIRNSALRASLRGRAGVAVDRALLYVTGGLAVAGGNGADATYAYGYNNNNGSSTRLGWTAGAGVEYAFTQNWSARLEYRYSDFGRSNNGSYAFTPSVRRTENAVRLGVSYHFSAPSYPVVAKY